MEIDDTLGFLAGGWALTRVIDDHLAGIQAVFEATAASSEPAGSRRGERARYEEAGRLRVGAYEGAARRILYLGRQGAGGVMVYFADRRPFVDLDLSGGAWRSVHLCGEDRYEITTVVTSADSFEESWSVRGPSKSYDAAATFTRSRRPSPL